MSAATRVRFALNGLASGGSLHIDNLQIAYVKPLNGGTTAFSSAVASSSVTVNSVNDAPMGTNNMVTTKQSTPFAFTTAAFGFSDPSDTPPNALLAVKISTLPRAGALTLSGAAVSAGQFVSAADISAGKLVFTPAANANAAGYSSFGFQVQDNGGTANGGVDLDPVARTLTINVVSANNAPIGSIPTLGNIGVMGSPALINTVPVNVAPSTVTAGLPDTLADSYLGAAPIAIAAPSSFIAITGGAINLASARSAGGVQIATTEAIIASEDIGSTLDSSSLTAGRASLQLVEVRESTREYRHLLTAVLPESQYLYLPSEEMPDGTIAFTSADSLARSVARSHAIESSAMLDAFDEIRESSREQRHFEATAIALAAAGSLGLSVGYVIWLLRGGVLLSSLLASLPAWRFVDPLPILGRLDHDEEVEDGDDDSLESIVARHSVQVSSTSIAAKRAPSTSDGIPRTSSR
jgi:hypothetical protein